MKFNKKQLKLLNQILKDEVSKQDNLLFRAEHFAKGGINKAFWVKRAKTHENKIVNINAILEKINSPTP